MKSLKIVSYVYSFDHRHLQWCIVPFLFGGVALHFCAASASHVEAGRLAGGVGRVDGAVEGNIIRLAR